jgi:serine/threonine protein kinase
LESNLPELILFIIAGYGTMVESSNVVRALSDRKSNPIISTEEDDDYEDEPDKLSTLEVSQSTHQIPKTSSHSHSSFDATRHDKKRGNGYLASSVALSTPPDVFASGCTLLQLCAIGDLYKVKEYLDTKFMGVNFRDYDRRTALHVASSEGHLDVVKYLVEVKNANVNPCDRWGGSPLDDAHRHRHAQVAKYLRGKGGATGSVNSSASLIAAAAAGDMEEVAMLLSSDTDLDLSSSKHYNGSAPTVRVGDHRLSISEPSALSNKTAININMGDYDGRTPLHLAASGGHLDVVKLLCRHGANVNCEDRWGGKPLDDALLKDYTAVADYLRKHGATSAQEEVQRTWISNRSSVCSVQSSMQQDPSDDEHFHVEFSELEMIERIGAGAFGEIYKCRWRGILVAAKCIKASKIQREWLLKKGADVKNSDRIQNRIEAIRQAAITEEEKEEALADFRKEISFMRRLRHPNVAMMLGYSFSDNVEVMITEICRCSLLDIFKANKINNWQLPKRTQIVYAQQLAQGMNYLHTGRTPLIHRDLKPANLLIDFSGILKITDFGLATIRPQANQTKQEVFLMTGETGSYRFMAPEVFRHEEYTDSVDVYSYSMILYQIILGDAPWGSLSGLDAVTKAAVDGERPLIPRNVDGRLSSLLKQCWDENPFSRPSFAEIIEILSAYSQDVFDSKDCDVQMMTNVLSHESKCKCVVS